MKSEGNTLLVISLQLKFLHFFLSFDGSMKNSQIAGTNKANKLLNDGFVVNGFFFPLSAIQFF